MIDILKTLESKFTSHNSVDVERTTLTRSEYDQIVAEIEALKAENVSLRKFVETVSDEDFLFNEFQGMQSRIRMKTKAMIENIIGELK